MWIFIFLIELGNECAHQRICLYRYKMSTMKYFYAVLIFIFSGLMIQLQAQPGNGFTCQEAACLSENLGVTLNNGGSPPTPPLSFSCGVTHNNLFYAFCPETGQVTLNITPANCLTGLGVQAIIYQTDDCSNFQELVCISNGNVDPFTINFSGTPGETYILMIDGFSGDVCDFTVSGTGIADITGPPNEPILDPSDDPLIICQGEQLDIQIENDDQECTAYFWEVQSGLGFITLNENGSMATINAISEGVAVLCVKADNFCYESELCIDVEVTPPPTLDPIQDIFTCEESVDFCDYEFFFDPPLEPDPISEGWDISFHRTLPDAEQGVNEIQCPYDLQGQTNHTIYIRVETGAACYSVQPFNIIFQKPEMEDIFLDPYCGPQVIDLEEEIQPRDINGLEYTSVTFHETEIDAIDGVFELRPAILEECGDYIIWVRAETDFGCSDVQAVEITIVCTPEIEIEPPGPLCYTDDFEVDLSELFCNELSGFYTCDDIEVRWYDFPPNEDDLDFHINPPIVYDPGCYWAVGMVERGGVGSPRYCASDTFRVCLDTVSAPTVEMEVLPPVCPDDETIIIFTFTGQGPFDVDYELTNQDGTLVTDGAFSTDDDELVWEEEVDIDPLDVTGDSVCVSVVFFEGPVLTEDECEPIIGDPVCFEYPGDGTLTLGVDQSICLGESADLTFSYTGNDSITVTYTDGTTNFTINNLRDGHIETVNPTETTTYELVDATNPAGCEVILQGQATVTVNTPPTFNVVDYFCTPQRQYRATIVISGGVPGTYTIDGNLVAAPNDTFVTILYDNNTVQILELDDANGCGPVEITLQRNCDCPNEAGTMQPDLLELCVGETAIGTHNADSTTFGVYNFYFALHTGSGPALGNLLNTNVNPQFDFDPATMMTGTRYYISAVCGVDDGMGGIDLQDSCTQVSVGQPVIWYDLPTASLDGETLVCEGTRVSIPVVFTGELPFTAQVDTNGVVFDTVTFNNRNATLQITPQGNPTVVTIPWLIDGQGCEGSGIDDFVINTSAAPEGLAFNYACDNTNTNYTVQIEITGGTGNYTINNNPVTSPFTTPPIPSGETRIYLIDDDLGCGPDTVEVFRDCDCETDPGTIEPQNLNLCVDETGTITQVIPPTTDGNDTTGYIIYVNVNNPFGTTIAYFTTTTIDFNMPLIGGITFNLGQTYYISPVAGDNDGMGFIDYENDDCARAGTPIELVWNPLPMLEFTGAEDICVWDEVDLNIRFTEGSSPFTVDYTINNGPNQQLTSNTNNTTLSIVGGDPNFPPGTYDIELAQVTDANGCITPLGLEQTVNVLDTIEVSSWTAECDGSQENYRVSFTISGGSGVYRVNGDLAPANYVSPWIPAGTTTFRFRVTDENGCDTDIIEGEHDCDCPNPGIVEENPLELCEDEVAMVSEPPNTGVQLFDFDTLEFILHTSSTSQRGTILLRSPDGTFTFDPGVLDYGVTYYMSRMVGDDDGNGMVDLSDECSEEVSAGQPVTWYQNPEVILDNPASLILDCDNRSYTLTGENSTPAGNIQFQWILEDNGQTNSPLDGRNIVVSNPGTYILEVTTLNSPCVARDTVVVTQDQDLPQVFIEDPEILNCYEPMAILDASTSDFGPDFDWEWILPNGSTITADSQRLEVTEPGEYTLRVINTTNNCDQEYSVTVEEDFETPMVDPGLGGMFDCHTDSIRLVGSASSGSGEYTLQWYRNGNAIAGATSELLVVFDGGWYALEAFDPVNGCSAIDSVFVSSDENIPNDALVQAFDPQCHDEENGYINIDSVSGGRTPYEYSVNGGPFTLTPTFFNLGAGDYDVTVRDQNGCSWSTTITINNPPPVEASLGGDTTIVWGDTISLLGNITNVDLLGEGEWDIDTITISYVDSVSCTNCPNPSADVSPTTPTIYTMTVVTTNGCTATANRRVNVEVLRPFFVPTAFSPNGDGINDFVTLHLNNLKFIEEVNDFQMYDRWGERVYLNEEIQLASQIDLWDGTFNGDFMNPQVLIWTVEVVYKDGHTEQYSGDITLMR